MSKDRRLGKGLAALLGSPTDHPADDVADLAAADSAAADSALGQGYDDEFREASPRQPARPAADDALLRLSVYDIDDNPFQPRRDFSEPEIASLAESLKEHEMLQPILVRRVGGRYQLISGERRLRAAIQAGWETVPARLRDADDRLVAELAIVENLQRKDLNPVEKALSFKRYLDEHQCTQEDLAGRLKIDRSTIANLVRLLELPDPILDDLRRGKLTAGHCRALLPLGEEELQLEFADRIQREGMSVRATERGVQELIEAVDGPAAQQAQRKKTRTRNQQIVSLEEELKRALGTRVEIQQNSRGRGKVAIHFTSHREFERLWEILIGEEEADLRKVG